MSGFATRTRRSVSLRVILDNTLAKLTKVIPSPFLSTKSFHEVRLQGYCSGSATVAVLDDEGSE